MVSVPAPAEILQTRIKRFSVDPFAHNRTCYFSPGFMIEGCECHSSCASCGYALLPGPDNCITCADGGALGGAVENHDANGTGSCPTESQHNRQLRFSRILEAGDEATDRIEQLAATLQNTIVLVLGAVPGMPHRHDYLFYAELVPKSTPVYGVEFSPKVPHIFVYNADDAAMKIGSALRSGARACVRACVRACECVRACVRACSVRACECTISQHKSRHCLHMQALSCVYLQSFTHLHSLYAAWESKDSISESEPWWHVRESYVISDIPDITSYYSGSVPMGNCSVDPLYILPRQKLEHEGHTALLQHLIVQRRAKSILEIGCGHNENHKAMKRMMHAGMLEVSSVHSMITMTHQVHNTLTTTGS